MGKILVTGGTGILGAAVVEKLQKREADFVIVSRNRKTNNSSDGGENAVPWQRIDMASGEGLSEALRGVDTVLHLASNGEKVGNQPFEVVAIQNLLDAALKADVQHLVYISIVGIDRIPFSYYQAKLAVEGIIQRSRVPYTILRATQFHNFINYQLGKMFSCPVGLVPKKLKAQPVSVEAVAAELFGIVEAGPQRKLFNIGGKQVLDVGTMAEAWQRYQPRTKPILTIPVVGKTMHAFAQGYNTCPEIAPSSQTWEEYLATTYQKDVKPAMLVESK